jgi:hypothetical protein
MGANTSQQKEGRLALAEPKMDGRLLVELGVERR